MGKCVPMDVLVSRPENSLVSQSRDASFHPGCPDKRNIRVNGDGFGIAWYTPRKIDEGGCVVKFPTPAWSSTNLLNIAKFVESSLVFAHVRASSDGAILVGNVNYENTHPFKYKRYTFMHNGGIPGFDRMKRHLLAELGDEAYQAIEGTTDSEVCFAFFLDELPNTDEQLGAAEIAQVMRRTIARIVSAIALSAAAPPCPRGSSGASTAAAASSAGGDSGVSGDGVGNGASDSGGSCAGIGGDFAAAESPAAAPAMSLNLCVTDGRHIVCSRYRNHPRQDPPSLFVLSGAGFACEKEGSCLRLTAPEPHTSVVISSEPLCRSTKSWKLIPRNSMVVVEGAAPAAPASAPPTRNGDIKEDDGVVATDAFPDSDGGANFAPLARENALGLGLVASIKYESLRCHPSDTPAPDKAVPPNPAPLPTSRSRARYIGGRGGDKNLGKNSSRYLPVTEKLGGLRCGEAGGDGGGVGVGVGNDGSGGGGACV